MEDLVYESTVELPETGVAKTWDSLDYAPPMYKRTPGQWIWVTKLLQKI